MRALISVYDKTGIVEFANTLIEMGWEIISSGGTASALSAAGIAVLEVEDVTDSPEMLNGRVKTLHPRIHGGILADRTKPAHMEALITAGITPIDLVVCNLYPFRSDPSIELIDVGGPTMVRAAAKNHGSVGILVEPSDYEPV
ncbi:MAG: bifunctional phosphoribosylaminoimidazolecarboxamide formyltransferase/IMP cyclohydrolase PurH, partial [Actinomycetota bacterium]|nr:bifunctional phosphoribosylaminoimidazolecarboxamide formyltransferase/IMP cyclohydrolase PurH [Actinomycetota bacterium]